MRIKKKDIKESTNSDRVSKEVETGIENTKKLVQDTATEFKNIGIDDPDATQAAADVVTASLNTSKKLEETEEEDDVNGGIAYGELPAPTGGEYAKRQDKKLNPKMTKNQLAEAVLGKAERKVIKTFKVKDLK